MITCLMVIAWALLALHAHDIRIDRQLCAVVTELVRHDRLRLTAHCGQP